MSEKRYYEVEAKCGHVGKRKYINITFGVIARSKKEAAEIARKIPRVKHDYRDAINYVREITQEEFFAIVNKNNDDTFLTCKNIQEQRMYCVNLEERIQDRVIDEEDYQEKRKNRLEYLKMKRKALSKLERFDMCYL